MSDYLGRHSGKTIDDSIQAVIDYNLSYVEDVKTTRLQVLAEDRVTGTTIGYVNNKTFISEHYIGSLFTDEEWVKGANWQKGSYNKVDKESGKELIPTLLLQKLNGMVNIKTIGANLILTPLGELSAVAGGSSDYSSLSNKPSIGGIELTGNKSLATLGIQPAGAYITQTSLTNTLTNYITRVESDNFYVAKEEGKRLITEQEEAKLASAVTPQELSDGLSTKVTAVANQRLITEEEAIKLDSAITRTTFEEELSKKVDVVPGAGLITDSERTTIANAVDTTTLSTELAKKVTAVPNQRLIREDEATKLASAITSNDLEPYSLKDTTVLEEVKEITKEEKKYIKFFDEGTGIEKKISMSNFILGVSTVYPTARTLVGEKNGKNETFTTEYTYIAGSEKLNINGSIYYPNTGFYKEGDKIILSGAPIPEAGDFMFLEAVYLD